MILKLLFFLKKGKLGKFPFAVCVSAEHGGQADQEDEPGSGGGEQQLEGAVC